MFNKFLKFSSIQCPAGAVKDGKIVDGIGGTIFPGPAYVNSGALDGEVAYLIGKLKKWHLFWGGASIIAAEKILPPEEFAKRLDEEPFAKAWETMKDGFIKAVASELAVVRDAKEIILSGRLMRIKELRKNVKDLFEDHFDLPVVKQRGLEGKAKEAAQGSAIIGDGVVIAKASLQQDKRNLIVLYPKSLSLVVDTKNRYSHFIRCSHVDFVVLSPLGNCWKMYNPRNKPDIHVLFGHLTYHLLQSNEDGDFFHLFFPNKCHLKA